MTAESKTHTIAFYNTENLFDIFDDPFTNDNDFLPNSVKSWGQKKYDKKIYKLSEVLSQIGGISNSNPPSIIGLAEVENKAVLEDLIHSDKLVDFNYDYVHFNSPDERGIDVAFLYRKSCFELDSFEPYSIVFEEGEFNLDYTRDVLLVSGYLEGELIYFIVNHWPSRREGPELSNPKRMKAAILVLDIINNIKSMTSNPNLIVMGDFNDNPSDDTIMMLRHEAHLENPIEKEWVYGKGSLSHNFKWNLFDQILISPSFLDNFSGGFKLVEADIFNKKFLTQFKGKFKGQPYRTYVGNRYKGGFSDHFPVFINVKKML
ncbi:MAG: endonuclease [Bacteroidetes bacterium MedPE-SWsnd-G2]|nr:MAG: endonuclease [Bacteroidetes bacterium MedPE-SWsnd-G2]